MEVRVECTQVKLLHLPELSRDLKRGVPEDFTSEEYLKSFTLRNAINRGWVTVLKSATTNTRPRFVEIEKPKLKTVREEKLKAKQVELEKDKETKLEEPKKSRRGRKKKNEKSD